MNGKKIIVVVFAALLLFASFTSCAKKTLPGQPPKDENEARDYIVERYKAADTIYFRFDVCTMPIKSGDALELDVNYWFEVDVEGANAECGFKGTEYEFADYAGLCEVIDGIFSPEIAGRLKNSGLYLDIDGRMYTLDAARGTDATVGEVTDYAVKKESDTRYVLTVTYELISEDDFETVVGTASKDYVYEEVNGKFVFSQFEFYR